MQYVDITRDPIADVGRIYAHFDEPFTPEAHAALDDYMVANPKGKHGKHSYSLEQFGLTAQAARTEFADYIACYEIPVKG